MITLLPQKISQTARFDDALEYLPTRKTYSSTESHKKISAEVITDRYGIVTERANADFKKTLKRSTRSAILPISRRYIADQQYGVKLIKGNTPPTHYGVLASL